MDGGGRAALRHAGERVERQYGAYVVIDTLRINGRLTLGENIADVVGVSLAYEAMQRAMRGKPRTTIAASLRTAVSSSRTRARGTRSSGRKPRV